eukprot:XP_003390452.2 PREDICTED: uncharacterized protein LOC100641144 [Amphimedon queenslandica]
MFLPEEDRYSYSKERLESQISTLFGGRIAEEQIFGPDRVTTGASNDIQRATELARNMVTKWGLSEKLGPLTYSDEEGEVFLGHSVAQHKKISGQTQHMIDEEVRSIVDRNYERSVRLLQENESKLHLMAEALVRYETIDQEQIQEIMQGKEPSPPGNWSKSSKPPSDDGTDAPVEAAADTQEEKEDDAQKGSKESPDSKTGSIGDPASLH